VSQLIAKMHVTLPPFEAGFSPEFHFSPLVFLLKGMVEVNRHHIRKANERATMGLGVPIPPLYASGVRYREDPAGEENWRDCYGVLALGFGDCDNLVIWRVAELNEAGIAAEPVIKWQHLTREQSIAVGYPAEWVSEEGLWIVHCSVQMPDGTIEDVSKNLGMGGNVTSHV